MRLNCLCATNFDAFQKFLECQIKVHEKLYISSVRPGASCDLDFESEIVRVSSNPKFHRCKRRKKWNANLQMIFIFENHLILMSVCVCA